MKVPEGWRVATYDQVAFLNRESLGKATPADQEIQYLDIASIPKTGVVGETSRFRFSDAPSRARRIVRAHDTVVSTVRPYLRAFAYVEAPPENLVASTGFAVLSPRDVIDPRFLFQTILFEPFVESLKARMKGSNYPAVNPSDIAETELLLPPLPEQRRIAEVLGGVDEAIRATEAVIEQTRRVKQGLLQELLTRGIGHTRFKQTEIGEVPDTWEVCRLEELLAQTETPMRSGPFGSALLKSDLVSTGVPFLGIDNVHVERFNTSFSRFVSESKFKELSRFAVKPGDVMITIMGTVGRSCVVPAGIERSLSSKHTWVMSFDPAKYLPELVCWQLNFAPWVVSRIKKESQGGIMDAINSKVLRGLALPVPPMNEQREISGIHSALSETVSRSACQLSDLHATKRGLMQDLLTGRVRVGVSP